MDAAKSDAVFGGAERWAVESALGAALPQFRWFGGKARTVRATSILDAVPVASAGWLTLARVQYEHGPDETFVLPLAQARGAAAERIAAQPAGRLVIPLDGPAESPAVLYDPLADEVFARALLQMIADGQTASGLAGQLVGWAGKKFAELCGDPSAPLEIRLVSSEQSNSSIIFGQRLILKLFRRLEDGPNPELEIGAYLTERAGFTHIAPLAGAIEYHRAGQSAGAVAVLQGFVPNQGDAWTHTLKQLDAFFTRAVARTKMAPFDRRATRELLEQPVSLHPDDLNFDEAALLARRTAELHVALAAAEDNPEFAAEPFTVDDLGRFQKDCRSLTRQTLGLLAEKLPTLGAETAGEARRLLTCHAKLDARFGSLDRAQPSVQRTRCHGDYHLGQVLFTGDDFVILDFEGEPARSLAERRAKYSPLKDVAGMLRSFDYAVHVATNTYHAQHPKLDQVVLTRCGNFWFTVTCATFLQTYRKEVGQAPFLADSLDDVAALLDMYLLEKAVYELKYELNNRPDWVGIPLAAILQIVDSPATG